MPTLHGNVYFNSGNVNSLVSNLDNSSLIPNRSYTITLNGIDHMKDYGIKSNLSDSYGNVINGYTIPITFSTPADNVESVIDLVRKTDTTDTISVYVRSLRSLNYDSLEYTGYLRRYTNSGLTNGTTDITTYTNTDLPNIEHSIPNLLTQPYYFVSEFTNSHGVVKESDGTTVQKTQIFDIRGLAYMGRNYVYDKYDEDYRLNSYTPTRQMEVRLSADGNRMITLYFDINGGNHLNIGKFSKNSTTTWSRFGEDYRIYFADSLLDNNVQLHRYTTYPVHTTDNMWYTVMSTDLAFTEFGDRFIFLQGNHIKIHSFETNVNITSIDFGRNVHCISVSADGKRLLASATHATSHDNTTLIGTDKGGTAKVYDLDTYAIVADLSSMHIPTLNSEIYYGSDATLSGDGKTAVIWGTVNNSTTSHGFVWKFNDLTNIWIHIFTIEPPWSEYTRHRTPCAMSHDGNKTVVCCSIADSAFIYETSNNWLGAEMTKIVNNNINTCDISGDGETVLFAVSDGGQDNNIKVYRRNSDNWVGHDHPFEGFYNSRFSVVQSCALSYDASTICLQQTNGRLYTLRYNKENTNVSAVYDYFNKKSHFEFLDYNLGEPVWDTELYETNTNKSVAHYGIVDALSMSLIGQRVIVGSPEENKAYLYDNNSLVHTYTGSDRFGIRCSMTDLGNIIVIANNNNLYIYDGTTVESTYIKKIAFGGTTSDSPWNMKISKYGSTIIASDKVGSVSFKSWTTADNWVSDPTSKTHTRKDDTSTPISAIDLSYDGSVMVASGFLGPSKGHVHLFKNLGEDSVANVEIDGNNTHYVGQSIALSGLGTKAIVGSPIIPFPPSSDAVVHFIEINNDNMIVTKKTYSTTHTVRYGRSVSMDYHGYYAMVSGSGSEFNNYTTGSAIVIDMSVIDKPKVKELPITGLSQKGTPSLRPDWNGYGIHCKLSSRGDVAAVSGGGYAYLFKADLFLSTLRFPFSTDKESTDDSVAFTGGGTIIDNSLNLVAAQNEVLDLGSNASQFGTDKGFVVEFDAKITDTSTINRALTISNGMFHCEISFTNSHNQTMHVNSTDRNLAIAFSTGSHPASSWTDFKNFKYMYSHETNTARTYMNGVETGNSSAAIQELKTPTKVTMISFTGIQIKNLTFRVID